MDSRKSLQVVKSRYGGHVSAIEEPVEHSHLFLCNQDARKGMAVAGKFTATPLEEKSVEDEPLVYTRKQEAKDAVKLRKVTSTSILGFEDYKPVVLKGIGTPPIPDINARPSIEDILDRAREEEKEVKNRSCLAKDFTDFLGTIKDITGIFVKGKANRILSFPQNIDHLEKRALPKRSLGTCKKRKRKRPRRRKKERKKRWLGNNLRWKNQIAKAGIV